MNDFIKVYDDVLDDALCDELVDLFEKSPFQSDGQTGGGVDKTKKVSSDLLLFQHKEYNDVLLKLMPKLGKCFAEYIKEYYFLVVSMFSLDLQQAGRDKPVRLNAENFQDMSLEQVYTVMQQLFYILPPQMQKYDKGVGSYQYWHSETFPQKGANHSLHRVLLYILYLNDVEDGGETEFFYQNKKVKPKKGSLVISPCYFTHTHRGNIPVSSDKYILTSWMQFKDAQRLYTQG